MTTTNEIADVLLRLTLDRVMRPDKNIGVASADGSPESRLTIS